MGVTILNGNNGVKYDRIWYIEDIPVYEKIMPADYVADRDITSYIQKGQPFKPCRQMRTGKIMGITIHNTGDINPVKSGLKSAAEQYVLATYWGNMGGAIVHYYVSGNAIWQLLEDNEQGWHSGTGSATKMGNRSVQIGGNVDTIAIECVGASVEAEIATQKLTAYLCVKYGLNPNIDVYTHQYWSGKVCPIYILPHWNKFINDVKGVYDNMSNKDKPSDWAAKDWEFAKLIGITDGTRPHDPITREEAVVMLLRMSGIAESTLKGDLTK